MGTPVTRALRAGDLEPLMEILLADAVFRSGELDVAREVLEGALSKGEESGYRCAVAEETARPVGFACWGATPCTEGTFDLYWIAVHPGCQRKGLASRLLDEVLGDVTRSGGRLLVVETSGSEAYSPARRFYETRGFRETARIPDFYRPGDPKIVFTRPLHP